MGFAFDNPPDGSGAPPVRPVGGTPVKAVGAHPCGGPAISMRCGGSFALAGPTYRARPRCGGAHRARQEEVQQAADGQCRVYLRACGVQGHHLQQRARQQLCGTRERRTRRVHEEVVGGFRNTAQWQTQTIRTKHLKQTTIGSRPSCIL